MKTPIFQIILAVFFSLGVISCNNQGSRDKDNVNDSTAMNSNDNGAMNMDQNNDQDFMEEAAYGGLMEVELGKYAQQTAQNPRVKNFAAMMVKDHSKANDELKALAAKKNITLPAVLDEKHMDKINDVKEKRGADFDKEYIKEMVDDHDKDVDKFRKQAENGEDADIKAFAAKTLPVLITHQDSAKSIKDALK
ncbi:MAG: DUF4142 domain-containing protein [Chloroflexota bacterium]|jgi:putative membrane protein|nr:DUF4142 domain-containing protein [Lentimicrobium sp.]